ncbi:TonB family protein [Dyadobacter subterraneus]|uniref:TonB family protein n=1 Tax=Dyadobacter subterraneus TaxID=2773304 RepID=A0ABR9WJU2_9BACT|nr:energy transducer TonB [Dyadobacter subterraneus]MBE9465777.1 TonB family protein [Dyadobacter subterraneus]
MKRLLLILTLISYQAVSQMVYQPSDVDTQAMPAGGAGLLNQFIASNVQIPFRSSVKGVDGKVFVKGVVERNGTMSGFEIIKGIDSLCDKEAIRVMSLYKAWKPAVLKNEKVRQTVVYHLSFKSPALTNFDSSSWSFIHYYNDKYVVVTDPGQYRYRSIIPLDEKGIVKSDILYEELKAGKWKQISSIPFKRKELWYNVHGEIGVDSVRAYQLSAEDNYETNYVPYLTFQMDGKLLSYIEYFSLGKMAIKKSYYLSGMLKEMETFSDSSSINVTYYDNGQLRSVIENPKRSPEYFKDGKTFSAWDYDGTQKVKNGNGWWKYTSTVTEGSKKILVEEGEFTSGSKNGKWIGKLADNTVYYTEIYNAGKLLEGASFVNGEKITYQNKALQAQFKGGVTELYRFLGTNIIYPPDAAKMGISGRVFISFVVCEDGSLCDYKLEKGVRDDIDREALRVVKRMSGKWQPGEIRGQKVRVKYNLPVNFALQ